MNKFRYVYYLLLVMAVILLYNACQSRTITMPYRFIDYYKPSIAQLAQKEKTEIVQSFRFEKDNDLEGWLLVNDIKDGEVNNGILRMRSTGDDPYLVLNNPNLKAEEITAIQIRMKVSNGFLAKLYWTTDESPKFSEDTSHRFNLISDNKFHDYFISIEDISNWKGRLRQLRLDPTNRKSYIDIDEISLLNMPFVQYLLLKQSTESLRKASINNECRKIIFAFPPSKISHKVYIRRDSFFDFGYGVLKNAWGKSGDGVQFYVKAKDREGKEYTLFSAYIDPKHYENDRRWFDERIDLSHFKGQEIELILETKGSYPITKPFSRNPDTNYDYAVWSNPVVYNERDNKPNIILIVLDTLRADALGCYGYERKLSPNIDKLAADSHSVIFKNAFSSSPWTTPSHANLFTSKYLFLDMEYEKKYLPQSETTLAEVLHNNGYCTVAFTGGAWVSYKLGFDKGFELYSDTAGKGEIRRVYQDSINWLENNSNKRFFLFFHTYEVHTPYNRVQIARNFDPGRIPEKYQSNFRYVNQELRNMITTANKVEKDYIKALYDGGVQMADKYLGLLFEKLKELNLFENTVIIITSDHGEEFWDHFDFGATHGYSLYNELLHVPMIIYMPHLTMKKKSISENASLIDIFPTILDIVGIKDFDKQTIMSESLLPLIEGEKRTKDNMIFAELKDKSSKIRLQSIITDKYKYIYSLDGEAERIFEGFKVNIRNKEELFHLGYDPQERYNILTMESELAKAASAQLKDFIERNKTLLSKTIQKEELKIDEELRKKLEALGYIH